MLLTVLKSCRQQAQVYWPTPEEQDVYTQRVTELFPLLQGVCMSVDGLMLRTIEPVSFRVVRTFDRGSRVDCVCEVILSTASIYRGTVSIG